MIAFNVLQGQSTSVMPPNMVAPPTKKPAKTTLLEPEDDPGPDERGRQFIGRIPVATITVRELPPSFRIKFPDVSPLHGYLILSLCMTYLDVEDPTSKSLNHPIVDKFFNEYLEGDLCIKEEGEFYNIYRRVE